MSRRDLSELAKTLGIADAEVMTRAELRAAIERSQSTPRPVQPPWPTTWLGVARGLVASIVEQGLNLPDAAALIRGDTKLSTPPKPAPPVATVTLARIYAAQGHVQRAIDTLSEVLRSDPDHELARELRDEFVARKQRGSAQPVAHVRAELDPDSAPAPAAGEPEPVSLEAESVPPTAPVPISQAAASEPLASEPPASKPPASEPPATLDERVAALESTAAPADPAPVAPVAAAALATPIAIPPAPAKPPPRVPPRTLAAELVLIETSAPAAYVYWELSAATLRSVSPEQCSLLVVAHLPRTTGAERVERRLSISSPSGALRFTGLPERAVLRASLTRSAAPNGSSHAAPNKPLAVAGAVRAQEPPHDPAIQVLFCPSRVHNPADVAVRAVDHLANASRVAW